MSNRLRIKFDCTVTFDSDVPAMTRDLNDAFVGAVRGLYPGTFDATIEPGGLVAITHVTLRARTKIKRRQSLKT